MSVLLSLAMPLGLREVLNRLQRAAAPGEIDRLAGLLFLIYMARAALSVLGTYVLKVTGERIVADLRTRVYGHLHQLALAFFQSHSVGDLVSRLGTDVGAIRGALTDSIVAAVVQAVRLCGAGAILIALNARLSLLVLLAWPAIALLSRVYYMRIQGRAKALQAAMGQSSALATEALSLIRLVQSFARADYEVARYRGTVDRARRLANGNHLITSLFGAGLDLAFMTATLAVFWAGGREVLSGRLSVGDLVAFLLYSQNIAGAVGELAQIYASLGAASGALARVGEILRTPAADTGAGRELVSPPRGHRLSFDNVAFHFQEGAPVLDGVSFAVEQGERVAIVGESGVGKTTLVGLMLRLFDPVSGRVLLDGADLRELPVDMVRKCFGVVGQESELFAMSIAENIRYGRLDATDDEIREAAAMADAHGFIMSLPEGYRTLVGERGVAVSGGQRQRIALARAILARPGILVLDEATAALDRTAERRVFENLAKMGRTCSIVFITHRIGTTAEADKIIVVEAGRIVENGRHAELLARRGALFALSR